MDPARLDEWMPLPDPTAPPRVLTRTEAAALGYSPRAIQHRLDTGRWRRVLPHTFLTADTMTWPDRQLAALAFAGPGSMLTGAAALTDTGLRGVPHPGTVLVLAPATSRVRSRAWVRVRPTRRLPPPAWQPGPRCAPPARAVADLALECARLDDVRALVTDAVRRELCTVDEMLVELEAGPRNGSAHLRAALDDAAGGAWSAPEAHAARLLRRADVPPFEQNARIDLPGGGWLYADFLWRDLRAILEIDSETHHGLAPDAERTDDRDLLLETLSYSVVHRRPRVIAARPRDFTDGISAWLAARAAELSR